MKDFLYQFILGFLCTLGLFAFCLILVATIKIIYIYIKMIITPPKIQEEIIEKPKRKRKRKTSSSPQVVRSLEIDTSSVDKIYFKKSS